MEILSLGEKIKRRRKELNMTLKDLAGERITPGQISLVESGKSNPSMDLLEYLAEILNVSIEYVMETEESQAEKICGYFENIAETHIMSRNYDMADQYIESSIHYAEKYNLEYKKARAYYLKGKISYYQKDYAQAQQLFLAGNVTFIKLNYFLDIIRTYIRLGRITLHLKAYHSACTYFKQAEKVYLGNEIANDLLLGQIYYYIATTYFKLDDIDKSVNYSYLSKKKFEQVGNKREYSKSLLLLAEQYSKQGDLNTAIKFSEKSLMFAKDMNDLQYTAEIENNLGKLFYEFNNVEESFEHLNSARKIRKETSDEKLIDTLISLCENYIKLKDISSATEILEEIQYETQKTDKAKAIKYYLLKFRVNMLENNIIEAEYTLKQGLKFAEENELLVEKAEILINIGKFYIEIGKENEASSYLSEGVDLFKITGIIKNY
ncbi:helix-turn-helix domain-containing protein [Clostridium sp. DL1XJH146]